MIRILHVLGGLGVGGAERQLLEFSGRIDRTRFDITVLYYSVTPDSLEPAFRDAGVTVVGMNKFAVSVPSFFLKLRRAIRDASPDIVHTWLYSANFWGRWAAVTCGVRRLMASERAEVLRFHLVHYLTNKMLRRWTLRVDNSAAVARSLARYRGLPEEETYIVPNGVELPECDREAARREIRQEFKLPEDESIVLMVGRQNAQKNYPLFIKAGARVTREFHGVTFIGVGRWDLIDELRSLISSLGVGPAVRLVDQRSDVHRLLAAADVFCLTSHYEGMPNVVLEAMWSGLPVICTDFAGIRDLISSPELGIVVPLNDEVALADAIVRLLRDKSLSRRLGQAGRQLVRERYTYGPLVRKMERLYEQLYEQGPATCRSARKARGNRR